jgi:hypothetical protein
MQSKELLSILLAASSLTTLVRAASAQPVGQNDYVHVERLAERYLYDRATRITVNGAGAQAARLTSVPTTAALSARLGSDAAKLDQRREALRQVNGGYSHADVDIEVMGIDVQGERVTLHVVERTKLFYPSRPKGAPEAEEYALARDLDFVRGNGGWLLSATTIDEAADALLPVTEFWDDGAVTTTTLPPGLQPSSTERLPVSREARSSKMVPETAVALGSYNYAAMVTYAVAYWDTYNSSYRAYDNDCTNFISQIMSAGGWTYVGSGIFDRTNNGKWFYGSWTSTTSYTWAGAENWYWFATGSMRTTVIPNIWNLALADVLQADWDANGNINHSMFVTSLDITGEVYLTYHSVDTFAKKLSTLLAQNSSAWWYGHRT